jgi:hypothetical protein
MKKTIYCKGTTGIIEMVVEADNEKEIAKSAQIVCEKYGWTLIGENK